ncbi:MAG: hypothetical protein IPG06_20910 [Haliea sp.]|nr:hypothetical protein [Haliea sp.]
MCISTPLDVGASGDRRAVVRCCGCWCDFGYPAPLLAGGVLVAWYAPAFGPMRAPGCGLFVLLGGLSERRSVKHGGAFSIGFVVVIAAIAAEVNRIPMASCSACRPTAASIYFAQCRTLSRGSQARAQPTGLIPPATADRLGERAHRREAVVP